MIRSRSQWRSVAALVVAISAAAPSAAQLLTKEKNITVPVETGGVAPWKPAAGAVVDPGETGSLAAPANGRTLADWYVQQGSPSIALLVDRRLERLPADWDGTSRLVIAGERNADGKKQTAAVTIGVEQKARQVLQRDRRPLVKLLEDALVREMQLVRFKLIDPTLTERALSSRGQGGDTEYQSLKGAAGYILELEMTPNGGGVVLIGSLKNLSTGAIVANVRQPVEQDLAGSGTEVLAKAFVRRLTSSPLPT